MEKQENRPYGPKDFVIGEVVELTVKPTMLNSVLSGLFRKTARPATVLAKVVDVRQNEVIVFNPNPDAEASTMHGNYGDLLKVKRFVERKQ